MAKHIVGQALYQLIILFVIVFNGIIHINLFYNKGETWIPEEADNLDITLAGYMAENKTFVDNSGNTHAFDYSNKYSNSERSKLI